MGIYLKPSVPTDVTPEALENPLDDHASLIRQGCDMLWGNSGSPLGMTSPDGTQLFFNSVATMRGVQCPALPPPPTSCSYSIVKSSDPVAGSLVAPGATIRYTLTYNMASLAGCPLTTAKLVDVIPVGTQFVPGSATDGISPGADGVLTWTVSAPATTLTKTFKVQVMDSACTGNNIVTNVAKLLPYGATPLPSNSVSHSVDCPPIGLPNTQPVYAEDELKAEPYPLVSGVPTRLSVRVQNLTSNAVPVTVQFQVAPGATPLGVGLAYTTVASSSATLPGSGVAVLAANYIPVSSGNRCFKALVSTPGYAALATQSCLDLTEDFQPGHTEQPVFVLRNDTSSAQTYDLVVDNTCPGWSASVDPTQITGLAAGDSHDFTLSVTPPNPLTLGSGCHIDVQAWIGGELVGGIRKLDLPPVHLPTNINPPWEEPEITFNPDPPVEGVPGQVCIQIQNPLSSPKVVTINFSVADFGAGIGFTPAAALIGQSIQPGLHTYCAAWTPAAGGTLHRCILATLVQANALDQHSQHNIDIVHPATGDLSSLAIPFVAGNPGLATRNLSFGFTLVGINPMWTPTILTPGGDPAPGTIPGGGTVPLVLHFGLTGAARLFQPFVLPLSFSFGSQSRVEVTLLLDGSPESGFSVSLDPVWQYLPILIR